MPEGGLIGIDRVLPLQQSFVVGAEHLHVRSPM